jgi:hypothetical protein
MGARLGWPSGQVCGTGVEQDAVPGFGSHPALAPKGERIFEVNEVIRARMIKRRWMSLEP